MLDVRRLRIFREVALQGSISRAAAELGYTASAVSQHVSKLEQELGISLIQRSARRIRLTPAGEALVARSHEIIALVDDAEGAARQVAGRSPVVRLATFASASRTVVPAAAREVADLDPPIGIQLAEAEPPASLDALTAGDVDVALVWEYDFAPPLALPASVSAVKLVNDPIRVVLPRDHPLAGADAVRLGELAGETWLAPSPRSTCHDFVRQACRSAGFEPRVVAETDDCLACLGLVAQRVGVALLGELQLRGMLDGAVAAVPVIEPLIGRRIFAAFRDSRATSRTVVATVRALERAATRFASVTEVRSTSGAAAA